MYRMLKTRNENFYELVNGYTKCEYITGLYSTKQRNALTCTASCRNVLPGHKQPGPKDHILLLASIHIECSEKGY